jgi:isoleucyl-tRNA synthetase
MKSNLKVRQPLKRIILPIADEQERNEVQRMEDVILDEINVKAVEYVADDSGIVHKKAKANFKSIGPKFGKTVKPVAERIRNLTPAEIAELERNGTITVQADSLSCTLGREDVEIIREDIRGWLVESDGTLTVALDTELDDALVAEGTAREFVNRIQNMRKDAGFEVTDRINIYYQAPEKVRAMLESMRAYIQNETLAVTLSGDSRDGEFSSAFDLNGTSVQAVIERCARS